MALTYRLGGWVKADMDAICKAVSKIRTAEVILHPSLVALKQLIEEDPEVNMYFTTMFQQNFDPPQTNPIKDYMDMLRKMQSVITSAPVYGSELGSAPLNHLLIYVMATPSGTVAFINDKVNKCFKDILNSWKKVLDSAASQGVLNTQVNGMCSYNRVYAIEPNEKDDNCTFYQNTLRSEIVSKRKCIKEEVVFIVLLKFYVLSVFLGIFLQSFLCDARNAFW